VDIPRFSDFAEEPGTLEGSKLRLDDILNHEILIIGHRIALSKYDKNASGKCLTLQFYYPDNPSCLHVIFTGSDVLISQMEKYSDHIPFTAIIRKKNRHYELT
jgi:hypothetical protein